MCMVLKKKTTLFTSKLLQYVVDTSFILFTLKFKSLFISTF